MYVMYVTEDVRACSRIRKYKEIKKFESDTVLNYANLHYIIIARHKKNDTTHNDTQCN